MTTPTPGSGEEPMSYETTVEETSDGQFEVIVTTVQGDGAQRQQVGTHATRQKAELAASLIDRSAKRYEGAGDSSKDAPNFANPELP
jgi:hypothetical protein